MDAVLKKAKVIDVGNSFQELRFQTEDKEKKQKGVVLLCVKSLFGCRSL